MKFLKVYEPYSNPDLKDSKIVAEALLDCLKHGDTEAFRDVLVSFLMTANKKKLSKVSGIGRTTIYDIMNPEKEFNPELSTVAALLKVIAA